MGSISNHKSNPILSTNLSNYLIGQG